LSLTSKERNTLAVGGVIVALTLLIAYAIVPLLQAWSQLGDELETKLRAVEKLETRAEEQKKLLAQRDRLVAKLGSVLGPEATPPRQEPKKATDSATVKKPVEEPPATAAKAPAPEAGPPKPEANLKKPAEPVAAEKSAEKKPDKPEDKQRGIAVATHIERLAKKAGVEIKKVVPKKPSAARPADKFFRPAAWQISCEPKVQSLIKLLHALEKGERLLRIEQANFRCDLKKGQTVQVTLHVVGYEAVTR